MPCFQGKTTPLSELIQYNLALFGLTPFNPLTEDFAEGFWGLLFGQKWFGVPNLSGILGNGAVAEEDGT
jgi:hypothetical protein